MTAETITLGRQLFYGSNLAAQAGLSGIPRRFIAGLEKADVLGKLAAELASEVGAV